MSASITLIGAIEDHHRQQLANWLGEQALTFKTTQLTETSDSIAVERWQLSSVLPEAQLATMRQQLLHWSDETQVDHVLQQQTPNIRAGGVAVFDMDSTLIKAEVMDELAVEMGIGEQISAVTASAMRGEIDFTESFVRRLSFLNGLSSEVMDGVYQRIEHMDGISTLMRVLHHFGWHTAILSGGFTYFADRVKADHNMAEVHANVLEIIDGKLTGKHLGPIVDAARKKELLGDLVERTNTDWSQTIACGDGANDLLMLNQAALGVALHAKPIVRQQAPCPLNNLGLDGILYLLGLTSQEIREMV
ncbi:phosphoserine phosphatase SerB [Maribrevibacterium harenarium]|uniref:Phosphoserine phosphatase n=1 Tax=Maribrevibacterium harenarium TaxID=2589817 RepID=A0A501WZZ8_9GAMM|nr:phosphoserine phosphatase SerB [Maribrevibacterium harenarium]TPE52801.1 phosphoserine phosphatase SerB [Maribrevibacterium harenarium]